MALPSPVRAAAGYVALVVAVGVVFAAAVAPDDPTAAVVAGGATVVFGTLYALQASLRLRRVLAAFASQVPGEPTPEQGWLNDQSLSWTDPPLSVEGSTAARGLRLQTLVVEAGETTRYRSPIRAREAAREALESLDCEPAVEEFETRLPSPDPLHSTVRTVGVLAALLPGLGLFAGVMLWGADGGFMLALAGVALVALAGLWRWTTLRRFHAGFRALDDGLARGGVRTRWVDFESGLLRPRYRLHTDAGSVTVEGTAHPWGRVDPALRSVESARLPALEDCGTDIARALRADPDHLPVPERPPLSASQRGAFAGVGLAVLAFGTVLATGGASLLAVGGALAALAGVACLAIGVHGRIPVR